MRLFYLLEVVIAWVAALSIPPMGLWAAAFGLALVAFIAIVVVLRVAGGPICAATVAIASLATV